MKVTTMHEDEFQRLDELLPCYVTNRLSDEDKRWVEAMVARSPKAAEALAFEQRFASSFQLGSDAIPEDVGLAQTMAKIKALKAPIPDKHPPQGFIDQITSWFSWLARPQFSTALLALVMVQASIIGWQSGVFGVDEDKLVRTTTVEELRTLRVRFLATASAAQIETALIAAGARVIGGPNQFGDYWLASPSTSIDEMKKSLTKSGILAFMEFDPNGPPRR